VDIKKKACPTKLQRRRGFTLIELLVVIFIIALLATMVVIKVSTAAMHTRDSKRKADLKTLQTAIEMYYQRTGHYPKSINIPSVCDGCGGNNCKSSSNPQGNWIPDCSDFNWSTSYISAGQPHDPTENACWPHGQDCGSAGEAGAYEYWSNGDRYILAVRLENTSDSDINGAKVIDPRDPNSPQRSYALFWTGHIPPGELGQFCYVLAN